jgi:hypothetical protein
MSTQKPLATPTEKSYQFTIQVLVQIIVFLLGYAISKPISETVKIEPVLILFIVGILSFIVYLLPSSQSSSSNKITPLPNYWNTRINALADLWLEIQSVDEPLKSTFLKLYVSGLERNYEAALLEGREALAKRFRELIEKYEKQTK